MSSRDYYLFTGVVVGGILWGSITSLLENNGLIAIIGLAFSCLVMGVGLGMTIGSKHD